MTHLPIKLKQDMIISFKIKNKYFALIVCNILKLTVMKKKYSIHKENKVLLSPPKENKHHNHRNFLP